MIIKTMRLSKCLTQDDVARAAGVQRSTVSMWESGLSYPRTGTLRKLADLFGCTIDDLLRETQEGADEKVLEVLEDEEE